MYFDYEPNVSKLVCLVAALQNQSRFKFEVVRHFKGGKRKDGRVTPAVIASEIERLEKLDLDFYYRPGNPAIGGWGSIDLEFDHKRAYLRCIGAEGWFMPTFERCIADLGLVRTKAQQIQDFYARSEAVLAPHLFEHIKGSLRDGNYSAALSATVVFIEDRLRTKLSLAGQQLTGSDLAVYAFKTPGSLLPPLGYAGNAQDNAFILIKGWIGLVRNLHGHQATVPMSFEEAFAQLSGANYILWIIDCSRIK